MRPSDLGGRLKDVVFVLTEQTIVETENQHVKEMLLENQKKKKKWQDMSGDRGQQWASRLETGRRVGVPEDWTRSCSWRGEGSREGEAEMGQDSS